MVHQLQKRVLHLTFKRIAYVKREMEERMPKIFHQHKEIGAALYRCDRDDSCPMLCLRGVFGGEVGRGYGCGVLRGEGLFLSFS